MLERFPANGHRGRGRQESRRNFYWRCRRKQGFFGERGYTRSDGAFGSGEAVDCWFPRFRDFDRSNHTQHRRTDSFEFEIGEGKLMTQFNMIRHSAIYSAVFSIAYLFSFSSASAETFKWGDLSDPNGDIMYLDVTENNAYDRPLYDEEPGVGEPDVVGNSIIFNPQNFQSSSSGGESEIIDSQMSTTIMADKGWAVESISISELGDYTLSGLSGGEAMASVGAAFLWTIEEINGLPNLQPTQMANMMFSTGGGPNGGEYARPGDDGTAVIWSGSVFLDVREWLNNNGFEDDFATKVRLTFDNTLMTAADERSSAFIKKKEIGGSVIVTVDTNVIPEPSTLALAGLALLGLAATRRLG